MAQGNTESSNRTYITGTTRRKEYDATTAMAILSKLCHANE